MQPGLELLSVAYWYASELNCDLWDFAVEIGDLERAGLSKPDLRWLICRNYIENGMETSELGEARRCFANRGGLQFSDRTCFVLTPSGIAFARAMDNQGIATPVDTYRGKTDSALALTGPSPGQALTPVWDPDARQLRMGKVVVKEFRCPAENQVRIMATFQELSWPKRIDDPLPPDGDIDPKKRLHDAINSFNRSRISPLIRLKGDGTGEGIIWEREFSHGGRHAPRAVKQKS